MINKETKSQKRKKGIAMKKIFVILLISSLANAAAAETRQGVLDKLNNTVVKKLGVLDGFTLPEVLDILSNASGNTVNFMYMPHLGKNKVAPNSATNAPPRFPAINPATGLPITTIGQPLPPPPIGIPGFIPPVNSGGLFPPQGGDVVGFPEVMPKIRGVRIKLRGVTLKQLLDITTMSFDKPVKYLVTEYGVIFIPREENKPLLFNRVYQINPKKIK